MSTTNETKEITTGSEQQYSIKKAKQFADKTANAPTIDGGLDSEKQLDHEEILKYFELITGTKQLADNETIRLTHFDYGSPYKNQEGLTKEQKIEMKGGQTTSFEQIRNGQELYNVMLKVYTATHKRDPKRMKDVGFSIGAGIFENDVPEEGASKKAPHANSFLRLNTFVFDMDAKVSADPKADRFPFNNLLEEYQQIWAMHLLQIANGVLQESGANIRFAPYKVYSTGGGLQFIIKFDKYMNKDQTEKVFSMFKTAINKANKYQTITAFIDSSKYVDIDGDGKDPYHKTPVTFEFDTSSLDITHTQRCGGTINPKELYGRPFSHELKMPAAESEKECNKLLKFIEDEILPIYTKHTLAEKLKEYEERMRLESNSKIKGKIRLDKPSDKEISDSYLANSAKVIKNYREWVVTGKKINVLNRRTEYAIEHNIKEEDYNSIIFDIDDTFVHTNTLLVDTKIYLAEPDVKFAQTSFLMRSENSSIYELLKKVTPRQQYEYMVKTIGEPLQLGASFDKFLCPFHDESSPSFAIYHNGASSRDQFDNSGKTVISNDFHSLDNGEKKNHNMVTLAVDVKNKGKEETDEDWVTTSDIISDIVATLSLELTKTEKNTFNKSEEEGTVANLLKKIDQKNKIYYRKANKMKDCVIREFTNGTYEIFDGTKSMTDHILRVHLKETAKTLEFRQIFHDAFVERILINAFEEFSPGNANRFNLEGNEYVNMWVACDAHNKVHELAKTIDEMDLTSALELIGDRLPASNYFLHQLTQKGSIEYFTNWLVNVAQYKVMPSIPVITSVQGTGKGIFIKQWLKYYLGDQYTNVVTSDKLGSNFNAFMETSSMLALDEGDFSNTKDVDTLKFLSGNDKIQLEKKGVDSVQKDKYFNMVMLTNGDTPLKHPSNDRRITYFRLDASMDLTINYTPWETIDDFIEALQLEAKEFWAILLKTKSVKKWEQMNLKDNQFNKQILQMHAFGEFALKVINGEWDDIEFQLNEKVIDEDVETMNSNTVNAIKQEFEQTNMIGLTLINKYLASLKYQSYITIENFIKQNQLHKNGISMVKHGGRMKIKIEKEKAKRLIYMPNNLGKLYPDFIDKNIDKTLGTYISDDIVEDEGLQVHPTSINIPVNEVTPADPLNMHPSVVPPSPLTINTAEM